MRFLDSAPPKSVTNFKSPKILDTGDYVTLPIHSHAEVTAVIADLGLRIFAILILIIMNPDVGMD